MGVFVGANTGVATGDLAMGAEMGALVAGAVVLGALVTGILVCGCAVGAFGIGAGAPGLLVGARVVALGIGANAIGMRAGARVKGDTILGTLATGNGTAGDGATGGTAAGATIGERPIGASVVAVCRVKVRETTGPAPHRALRHKYGWAVTMYVVPSILNWGQLLKTTCPLLGSLASPQRVNGADLSTIGCPLADWMVRANLTDRVPEPCTTARMFKDEASKSCFTVAAPTTIPLVMFARICPVCANTSSRT
jgi:hypothetical protein